MKTIKDYIQETKQSFRIKSHLKKEDQYKDCIDLDLPSGKKWAACNVGANKPEEYGDYFAWGETEPKKNYSWDTYKYDDNLIKYNYSDKKKTLDMEDDAAYVNTKGELRMPTKDEFEELFKYTDYQKDTINGVEGAKFISKRDKTKWIFIPFSGNKFMSNTYDERNNLSLWSSSLLVNSSWSSSNFVSAFYANGEHNSVNMDDDIRVYGFSVRGILNK